MNPFPEAQEIATYIRNTSGPDDAVFVLDQWIGAAGSLAPATCRS